MGAIGKSVAMAAIGRVGDIGQASIAGRRVRCNLGLGSPACAVDDAKIIGNFGGRDCLAFDSVDA